MLYQLIYFVLQLIHEDSDIAGVAVKCQSLLVQLFGGENGDAMTPENMVRKSYTSIIARIYT